MFAWKNRGLRSLRFGFRLRLRFFQHRPRLLQQDVGEASHLSVESHGRVPPLVDRFLRRTDGADDIALFKTFLAEINSLRRNPFEVGPVIFEAETTTLKVIVANAVDHTGFRIAAGGTPKTFGYPWLLI